MPRAGRLVVGLLLLSRPAAAAAAADGLEKQLRPFIGVTFKGSGTFVDLEKAAGAPNIVLGGEAVLIGNIVGVEVDVGWAPGFFQYSGVTTITGNVIVAMPRRLTEYTLRPYVVAGAGVMHVRIDDYFGVLPVRDNVPVMNIGAGAIGFVTNRVGVAWEVRRFSSINRTTGAVGVTTGGELSFWRATMAIAIKY